MFWKSCILTGTNTADIFEKFFKSGRCYLPRSKLPTFTAPFSPPPPPPRSGAPPTSHTSSLITVLFVASHMAIQGCFIKKNFFWYKLLALTYINNSFSVFPLGITFRTFTHFFAEKCTLPLPDNNFEKSFSRSFTIAFTFFYEGKGDEMGDDW